MARRVKRVKKVTPNLLKKMIFQEAAKLRETLEQGKSDSEKVKPDEVEAEDLAGTLEQDIDYMNALKIHESILKKKLGKVFKAKKVIRARMRRKV